MQEEEKKGGQHVVHVHMVKAQDKDKEQLSAYPVEDFQEFQQKRFFDKAQPVPKEVLGLYQEYLIGTIED